MDSCSSPSTIGSLDSKPTSIHLITMKPAMSILFFYIGVYQNFSKNPNPVDQTPEIGSPDFKPTYIRLITMICVTSLLIVLLHRGFFNSPRLRKIQLHSPGGLNSRNTSSEF